MVDNYLPVILSIEDTFRLQPFHFLVRLLQTVAGCTWVPMVSASSELIHCWKSDFEGESFLICRHKPDYHTTKSLIYCKITYKK